MLENHSSHIASSMGDETIETASTTSSSSEDNRIKVVCRVRPPVSRERHGAKNLSVANRCVVVADDRRTVTLNSKPQEKKFTFDYAAGEDSTQEELFAEVGKPVTEACLEGYNGTIFCYGQTGSGKTFTTFGPGAVMENHLNPSDPKSYALRGLVPRVLEYLYANIARLVDNGGGKVSYSCKCSFYEIFNEKVFDLVDESNRDNPMGLTVREDTRKGVYVEGLVEEHVDGVESACEVLHRGFRNRHVGETAMNRESSRSHAVFTLIIQAKEVVEEEGLTRSRVARFNLVDLAGSERQKDTQASGERLKEASNINKSLSTLGQVINALVEKSAGRFRHIHYRDSKLTFLLRDSLGGNSKTMLVAALSPADQNFGETLSTLKFAQRAKMIKNQAVKNEDTSGSFDALRREVSSLRQKLAAAQQQPMRDHGGFPHGVAGGERFTESDGAEGAGTAAGGVDAAASEALLANALRRARSAEEAQAGARRRVESLLAAVDKGEKDALQLKMIIKFRDGTIAAQRRKDPDQERAAMADENAYLLKQLEGGATESAEVTKLRLQFKEAEARLAELTGDKTGDSKRLVWGVGDEERFHAELDEKVLGLMEENRQLTEAAEAFEERLHHETRRAEKRRLSAENRADLEAKKIVENALLSKLREAQRQVDESRVGLVASEERITALENERARQTAAVSALTKQLKDANRREKEAVEDRDVRLADLQNKIGELSQATERAVSDGGSEAASLKVKICGLIKDNSELLRVYKALEQEADGLDRELEQLEAEKKRLEEKGAAERAEANAAIENLEGRMKQQQEAHDREFEEQQAEKRSVAEDLEAVTERLKSATEAHRKEVAEHQRRSDDLQERLVETRALKEETEGRLKQLRDDYDTLSDQAHFTQSRNQELEASLDRSAEDLRRAIAAGTARAVATQFQLLDTRARLSVAEERLIKAERHAEGEEFFKLAEGRLRVRAEEECARKDQEIGCLVEDLAAAQTYAEGLHRSLVLAAKDEGGHETSHEGWGVEGKVETESREAMVGGAVMCRELMEEFEIKLEKVQGLQEKVGELVESEGGLMEEIYGLQHRIQELEATGEVTTANLKTKSEQLEAANMSLERVEEQQAATSEALGVQEAANLSLQEKLTLAESTLSKVGLEKEEAQKSAKAAMVKSTELNTTLADVRNSCFEYQARAVTAEGSLETLAADMALLEEEKEDALSREQALMAELEAGKEAAIARDAQLEKKEEELTDLATGMARLEEEKEDALSREQALMAELEAGKEAAIARDAQLEKKEEELTVLATGMARLEEEKEDALSREQALMAELEAGKEAAIARDTQLEKKEEELTVLATGVARLEEEKTQALSREQALVAELEAGKEAAIARDTQLEKKEEELTVLAAGVARLEEEKKQALSREEALMGVVEAGKEVVIAKDKQLEANEEAMDALTANVAGKTDELAALNEELANARLEVSVGQDKLQETEKALKGESERAQTAEKEVAAAKRAVEGLEKEVDDLEARVKDANRDLTAAKEEVAVTRGVVKEVEEHLSAEMAKTEAEEIRAQQAEALRMKSEELSSSLGHEVVQLREECRTTADRLEESEAVNRVHAGKVIDLKKEVERLQGSMMSQEERECLTSDLESAQQNVAEMERMLEAATTRNADLEEEIRTMRGETEGYTAKVMELKDVNASLLGHKNSRQKIQQVQRLKEENNLLSRKVKELDDRLFNIKRSGCGPGCGKHASSSGKEGEAGTASTTSSSAGSQHSLSPKTRHGSGGAGAGAGGVESGEETRSGKTYNLRRRPKIADVATGVSTRGRKPGLRDMTNAN